jgi:hypothetical protein
MFVLTAETDLPEIMVYDFRLVRDLPFGRTPMLLKMHDPTILLRQRGLLAAEPARHKILPFS